MGNNQHTAPEHQEKNRTLTLLAVLVILVIIGTGFSLFAGSVRIPLSKFLPVLLVKPNRLFWFI